MGSKLDASTAAARDHRLEEPSSASAEFDAPSASAEFDAPAEPSASAEFDAPSASAEFDAPSASVDFSLSIRIGRHRLTVPRWCVAAIQERLRAVPMLEQSDIAFRASSMIRQAYRDGQLHLPLRGDFEDAVAMLVVLGVTIVHT